MLLLIIDQLLKLFGCHILVLFKGLFLFDALLNRLGVFGEFHGRDTLLLRVLTGSKTDHQVGHGIPVVQTSL